MMRVLFIVLIFLLTAQVPGVLVAAVISMQEQEPLEEGELSEEAESGERAVPEIGTYELRR